MEEQTQEEEAKKTEKLLLSEAIQQKIEDLVNSDGSRNPQKLNIQLAEYMCEPPKNIGDLEAYPDFMTGRVVGRVGVSFDFDMPGIVGKVNTWVRVFEGRGRGKTDLDVSSFTLTFDPSEAGAEGPNLKFDIAPTGSRSSHRYGNRDAQVEEIKAFLSILEGEINLIPPGKDDLKPGDLSQI